MRTVTIDKPRPHVSVVSLNRPERLNAMSIELCLDRKSALGQVAVDNDTAAARLRRAARGPVPTGGR